MRLLVSALALLAVALPAHAQRITRWGTVATSNAGTPAVDYVTPTGAIPTMSFQMCYDGATWDPCTTSGSANTGIYVEDAAETAGGGLSMAGATVRAGKTGSTATAADNATINVTTEGGLWGASDQVEDAAETAGTPLAMAGAVVRSTQAGSTATDADNGTLNLTTYGALYVASQPAPGTITVGVVDVAASGTAVQGASAAAKVCYISCPTLNTSGCYVRMSAGNGVTGGFSVPKGTITPALPCTNTNIFYLDAGTSGDDVTILSIN